MVWAGIEGTLVSSSAPDVAIVFRRGADGEKDSSLDVLIANSIRANALGQRTPDGQPIATTELVRTKRMRKISDSCSGPSCYDVLLVRGLGPEGYAFRGNVQ